MEIRIDSLIEGAQRAEGTVIIIDVFRAFTTAAVAFARGAKKIILVAEVEEAIALRGQGRGELCFGEVGGARPEGFDMGNSPFELSESDVRGKTLIQSTRAGTVGVSAAKKASQIYVSSLAIAEATAKAVCNENPDLVTIVAMGNQGEVRTDEDEQCALYLRNLIEGRPQDRGAVRTLVMNSKWSENFDDPAQPHFHPKDKEIALQIDSIPVYIRVSREGGLLVARPGGI